MRSASKTAGISHTLPAPCTQLAPALGGGLQRPELWSSLHRRGSAVATVSQKVDCNQAWLWRLPLIHSLGRWHLQGTCPLLWANCL